MAWILWLKRLARMLLKPKPWWLRAVTQPYQWVTIHPVVYYPLDKDPQQYPALIAHEAVHLAQQSATGLVKWLSRYASDRAFRLQQEVEAIIVELSHYPEDMREHVLIGYAASLAGRDYCWAAKSKEDAEQAIRTTMEVVRW
jgi:hypothetical protein